MTYAELVSLINTNLTRVGTNRISGPEVKEVCQALLDFAAAIDNNDAIPGWTALLTFQTDGTGAGKYCTHPDANGQKRIWETKIANNTGNEPPTDPNTTSDANWEEISASAGSGIQEWSPGLYGAGLVIVYLNHSIHGPGLCILLDPVRPFSSTNIEAEITAGSWAFVSISKDYVDAQLTALKDGVPSSGDSLNKLYNLITSIGRPRGGFDASSGAVPTPTGDNEAGDFWRITVAGTIGTMVLKPGDLLIADIDNAAVAADFYAVQSNVDQATASVLGLVKLYTDLSASNIDGSVMQAALVAELQSGSLIAATASGTNTYTATISPAIVAYVNASRFFIKFTNGNTGPATLDLNGLGAKEIKKNGATDLSSGDIQDGQILCLSYDGTNFQVIGFYGLNITAEEIDSIPPGETNLFTVTKSIDGTMLSYGAGVRQIENFAAGLSSLLADTAAWEGDVITLNGDNLSGALGETAQEYVIENQRGTIYKCVAHFTGTTISNGSATWIRTRSRDNLVSGNTQDDLIILELEDEDGWDSVNNTKTITVRSKVGSWHTDISGYTYFCFAEVANTNWSWRRIGQPDAVPIDISDATLIAEIEAHNFVTTPILEPVATEKGKDMQRHYWETALVPNLAMCINKGTAKWLKIK